MHLMIIIIIIPIVEIVCMQTTRVLSVTFDETRMATGGRDKTIKLWSLSTGKCTHTMYGHTKGVWCLTFFSKSIIISGSFDSTIRVG
jgi:WD40 repeat protein